MLKLQKVADAYYKKNLSIKKKEDLAVLLFPKSTHAVAKALLARLFKNQAVTIKISNIPIIAKFYECDINELF